MFFKHKQSYKSNIQWQLLVAYLVLTINVGQHLNSIKVNIEVYIAHKAHCYNNTAAQHWHEGPSLFFAKHGHVVILHIVENSQNWLTNKLMIKHTPLPLMIQTSTQRTAFLLKKSSTSEDKTYCCNCNLQLAWSGINILTEPLYPPGRKFARGRAPF